jgi:hypothetical protein
MAEPAADPNAASLQEALTLTLLEGEWTLDKVRLGALRQQVAQRLGLPDDGLEGRADEVRSTAARVVESLGDWWGPEQLDGRQSVYLVTFAAVLAASSAAAEPPLRTLDGVTKEMVRDAMLDAAANLAQQPTLVSGRGRQRDCCSILKMAVFEELPKHFHVAVKFEERMRFAPLKAALRQRHALASHWSASHSMWWSALRYGAAVTEHKPEVDPAPLLWSASGEPLDVFAESQEPYMASVVRKRRETAALRPDPAKLAKGQAKERFTKFDLTALVISENLSTPAQVMRHVKQQGSAAMQAFVNRHQSRLPEFIQHAQEWVAADDVAEAETESDWDLLLRLSCLSCSCLGSECGWSRAAQQFFDRNSSTIDGEQLAACVANVIREGPAKTRRVPLLMGPSNAAKSTIFDPVDNVFGPEMVFHTPALGSAMALANLAVKHKRFVYLDDYRPVEFAAVRGRRPPTIPVVTFLKLAGGQSFEVQVSQSFQNGNADMRWTRGMVITAKDDGLWSLMEGVTAEDVRHMQSRVEVFVASTTLPRNSLVDVPLCRESWAKWVVGSAAAFAARASRPVLPLASGPVAAADLHEAFGSIHGFADLMAKAVVSQTAAESLFRDVASMGAISVQELFPNDWRSLTSWPTLLPFEQRRVLASVV